ncbi:hypothetical protein NKG94_32860 [Micromonospora sp. M12]
MSGNERTSPTRPRPPRIPAMPSITRRRPATRTGGPPSKRGCWRPPSGC